MLIFPFILQISQRLLRISGSGGQRHKGLNLNQLYNTIVKTKFCSHNQYNKYPALLIWTTKKDTASGALTYRHATMSAKSKMKDWVWKGV